jgi:hypothetical protein
MQITKTITKWLLGAAMAGALVLAAPHKADAQVVVGVRIGAPVVYAPAGYYGYGYRYGYRPHYYVRGGWGPAPIAPWRYDRYHYGWRERYYRHF